MCYCVITWILLLSLSLSFGSITCAERGWHYSGVRSGMATEEQDMEVDRQVPTSGANPLQVGAVRMSMRPPARFSATSDLALWLRRFELYAHQARISTEQWVAELLSLLDDEPF